MTQTDAERKAYRRGYHRGHMRMYDHLRKLITIAKALRGQVGAVAAMPACETCDRWRRGGDLCSWGVCRADFEYGVEPRMWAEDADALKAAPEIVTTEDFGCVGWLPRAASVALGESPQVQAGQQRGQE